MCVCFAIEILKETLCAEACLYEILQVINDKNSLEAQ
jgi:hypothetical protein